jgi:hypothetical protein
MKVGDLVKSHSCRDCLGIIIEVPPEDDHWGKTAVIQWICSRPWERKQEPSECEEAEFEVISETR